MKYSIEQLKHLRAIMTLDYDDYDGSGQINEKWDFVHYTDEFFNWLEKMENLNKIEALLKL